MQQTFLDLRKIGLKSKDRCFLILVIYMFVMFYFFSLQKAKNNILKKATWPKFSNIIFCFCLRKGRSGLVDQQINFVLPELFTWDHIYVSIMHKSIFFNWNITSSPYLEMLLINMTKLLFFFFSVIAMFDVASCNLWRI